MTGSTATVASRGQLERYLRRAPIGELCTLVDPFDPRWEGLLYEEQATRGAYDLAADDAEAGRHGLDVGFHRRWLHARRLREEGRASLVGGPWLASEAPTPFVLDGRRYASVACFHEALKLHEDDSERDAVALGLSRDRRRIRPARRGTFVYAQEELVVGSPAHGGLVARATEAKVDAHAEVRRALAATGRSLLFMGGRYGRAPQALGRFMPFALMVLRYRSKGRA